MRTALALVVIMLTSTVAFAQGGASRGQRIFQTCAACHSLEPNKNLTGPSLSGVYGRKAGTVESFTRYSDALKSSGIVWNDKTMDVWLANPQAIIPGNEMPFPGISSAQQRADLLAFLKQATEPGAHTAQGGGMGGMMGGGQVPNLKKLNAKDRVQTVRYCKDTYEVATADGKNRKFWERNLRFKTDSSADGPAKGAPALVPAGMVGDRADVIFSGPDEFGRFVRQDCPGNSN